MVAHLARPVLVVAHDHGGLVAAEDLRPEVQVGLGDHVELVALALGPHHEVPVELRPARRGEELREAVGEGPFLGGVARRVERPALGRVAEPRRAGRQPDEAARPGSLDAERGRELGATLAVDTVIGVGAAPIVVGEPGRGRQDQQETAFRLRVGGRHHEEMVLHEPRIVAAVAGRDHAIEARGQIGRQPPAMRHRPAAARAIGLLRRGMEPSFEIARLVDQHRLLAVAIDLQGPACRRGAGMEGDLAARRIGHGVGVGIDLRRRGILARHLVPMGEMPVVVGMHGHRLPRPHVHAAELRPPGSLVVAHVSALLNERKGPSPSARDDTVLLQQTRCHPARRLLRANRSEGPLP